MKRIINDKVYNTETATHICTYQHSYPSEFSYVKEDLYVSKKGQYFIAYEGGPLSKYAETCGNNTSGSEGIRLVDDERAKGFCAETMSADEFIERYPDTQEG